MNDGDLDALLSTPLDDVADDGLLHARRPSGRAA